MNAILDNPVTSLQRASIIRSKHFLHAFYRECYEYFRDSSRGVPSGIKLELGSGPGFIKEVMPDVITSDFLPLDIVDSVCSALHLPFPDRSLSAVFLLDVLHHLPDLNRFFDELNRCLLPGGVAAMIEPANTFWARFVYRHFHHESFDPTTTDWTLPPGGPLSTANGALPWIVFCRDREKYDRAYADLKVVDIEYFGPMLYILSGGFSHRQILPDCLYSIVRHGENALSPFNNFVGMFMKIKIRRRQTSVDDLSVNDVDT